MAESKGNLTGRLPDEVFQIHEEVLAESSLFKLHTLCDKILNENPNAKHDGGFKIRLCESLHGTGSTLKEFWTKFDNASKYLSSLYLVRDKNSTAAMEFRSRRVTASEGLEFKAAVRDPQTFDISHRNCCMQALDNGGPQAAVSHFYDCLLAKAIVIDNERTQSNKSSKSSYLERQSMVVETDPSLTCVQIEKSMMLIKYSVQNDTTKSARSEPKKTSHPFPNSFLPIDLNQFGDGKNCSLYFNGVEETSEKFLHITSNFALSHLCHVNMLTDIPYYFPGISYPFIYLGGVHSVFPIHIEDMSLYSINYNHFGYPKLIILVAPFEVSRLSLLLTTNGKSGAGTSCIQQLFHKTHVVFPQWLLEHNIKFKVIFLHPGEFFVFAPNAAHTGGNLGPNLAEACNFGSYDWLPFGSVASEGRCSCIEDTVQFDVTQLIRDHRKELLPYHKDKSKWSSYQDEHFQRSLIIPARAYTSLTCDLATSSKSSKSAPVPSKPEAQHAMVCPVKACRKPSKKALKATLIKHISERHQDCVDDPEVKQYIELRFPTSVKLEKKQS